MAKTDHETLWPQAQKTESCPARKADFRKRGGQNNRKLASLKAVAKDGKDVSTLVDIGDNIQVTKMAFDYLLGIQKGKSVPSDVALRSVVFNDVVNHTKMC